MILGTDFSIPPSHLWYILIYFLIINPCHTWAAFSHRSHGVQEKFRSPRCAQYDRNHLQIKPLSHQAAFPLRWHGVFKTSERRGIASKFWYLSRKRSFHGVITASLQRSWRWYRARKAFYCVHTELSLAILCALTTLSLGFQGARNACSALLRHPHYADGVLKTQCSDFPPFPKIWRGACWIWENSICAIKIRVYLFCLNEQDLHTK